jgi:pyruvate dehydrogenase E2 component (dihydrolipoamide acetyltransferase)
MENGFHLPDLGEGLPDAEIIAWHVAPGDHVVENQPLVSVETDKAVVEIPSPRAGHIASIFGSVGERIEVGSVLVEFETSAQDKGAVVGELESVQSPPPSRPSSASGAPGIKASPAVRSLAAELGVDLATLSPSGPGGVIVSADVEGARHESGRAVSETLRGVRRAMFTRMTEAHAHVVPATLTGEADVEPWPTDTLPLLRLVRAVGTACLAEPRLNIAFDEATMSITHGDTIDLGIATETDEGLFVPVLRDITNRDEADLASGIERIKADVDARTIAASDLSGQSITLSNFGAMGGLHASMVVVPPQVAIVGAGRIGSKVVLTDQQAASHRVLPLSITFDHRVITGVEASRFLNALIADLELSQ